ncbi:hypothetical protein P1X15_07195 [Runella sp. MFBS21]|nr:hypothetical protein [Runella sp. MFBS21]MDF7817372.1 hypothetical protein [Runella sp. MFBS21]
MKNKYNNNWSPQKRAKGLEEAWPFIALIGGVAALIGLLIWIIEILK